MRKSIIISGSLSLILLASCGEGKKIQDTVDVINDTETVFETPEEEQSSTFTYLEGDTATIKMLNRLTVIDGLDRPDELYTNPEGIKYRVLRDCNGDKAVLGKSVVYNYQSKKADGESLDNTYMNSPVEAVVGENMSEGFVTALGEMNSGAVYEFFIPAALNGTDYDVVYSIELLKLN